MSNKNINRTNNFFDIKDIESILEKIPQPICLVDAQTFTIICSNNKFRILTSLNCAEIRQKPINQFLEFSFDLPLYPLYLVVGNHQAILKLKNGDLPISIKIEPIDNQKNILMLELISPESSSLNKGNYNKQTIWKQIDTLLKIFDLSNEAEIISSIIKDIFPLIGPVNIAVYLADSKRPYFIRRFYSGFNDHLLEEISAYQITKLKNISIWTSEKQTKSYSVLAKISKDQDINYLISIPIGRSNAIIGLLIIAGKDKKPSDELQQSLIVISKYLDLVIRFFQQKTELQNSTHELSKIEYHYSFIKRNLKEGVLFLTPNYKILEMNFAAETIFGYTKDEVIGQAIDRIVLSSEFLVPKIENFNNHTDFFDKQIILLRRNGDEFPARVRFYPLYNENVIELLVLFVDDLSDREQTKSQSEHLEQRAQLGDITAMIAHEIRNPINNISTGLQLMSLNLPDNDPRQREISRLIQDCDRLNELGKSILALSKPVEFVFTQINIVSLLQRLLERHVHQMDVANIKYDLKTKPNIPYIYGDVKALEFVFNNLIINAIQAMSDKGGRLVIAIQPYLQNDNKSILKNQPFVEISVADTGPGIPKDIQDKIFHPFFTTKPNGTGLGLAIAKRNITFHKGNIRLESFPGGSIFYVLLPSMLENSESLYK